MQFGDMVIDEEPAADYLGKLNTGTPLCNSVGFVVHGEAEGGKIAFPRTITRPRFAWPRIIT